MLGLEPGNSFFNQEVTIRKTAPITGFNLAGKWLVNIEMLPQKNLGIF
jgi:hypothetical protein